MERTFVRSPFDNVLNFLSNIPQSHEKALKHALYNALAMILVFICGATAWGVFYVLKPFMKPLMWALLVGSVLHPFKYAITKRFELLIHQLEEAGTPIPLFFLMIPMRLVDDASEKLGSAIICHIKFLVAMFISTFIIFIGYHYIPGFCVTMLTTLCDISYQFLIIIMDHFSSRIFAAVIIGYIIALSYYWCEESCYLFSILSYCVWFLISLYAARSFGVLQIPLFLLLLFCLSFGFAFEVITVLNLTAENISCWTCVQKTLMGKPYSESKSVTETDGNDFVKQENLKETNSEENLEFSCSATPCGEPSVKSSDENNACTEEVSATQKKCYQTKTDFLTHSSIQKDERDSSMGEQSEIKNSANIQGMEQSTKYLYGVIWACSCMMLWKYMWIVHLLPIPIAVYVVKNLGIYFGVWQIFYSHGKDLLEAVMNWIELREMAIFPAPVKGLHKIAVKLRMNAMCTIRRSINSFASSLVILGLIFFTFSFTIFIALQIYAEGMHLISVGAEIINSTVVHNPEFLQLLPEEWTDKFDSALNNAYIYGREGISKQVQHFLKDVDKAKAAEFEKHLLEFWDRVYQAWLMGSFEKAAIGPKVNNAAVFTSWGNFVDLIYKTPDLFNLSVMTNFARENVGMFVSLFDSIWILLKGNISLIFQFFLATLSVLLGGGSAVVNFVISLIVFFTALFYLLNSSGVIYKPVDLLSNFSPVNGKKLAVAFEAAVNGVFKASFKMALFYGLWTWLIHNLFQVRIIYLPSVLAAILGAVPFLGTYWASIPAILDLWLAQHNGMLAIILLIFQGLPISFVDAAIYTEIKGGGHPYMTGLAIAGGVFCMGIEGAILGPVLLCCLLVALNMSSSLMRDSPSNEVPHISMRQLRRRDSSL